MFYTVIRPEEKWILEAAANRGIPVERLHDEEITFPLDRLARPKRKKPRKTEDKNREEQPPA
jgi:hypothetical protein